MLYFFRLLLLLIKIDQETFLRYFNIKDLSFHSKFCGDNVNILFKQMNFPLESSKLMLKEIWEGFQDGLTLADIENLLFFILFIRFIILTIRYNLKTSFIITFIGLFAGYLWYKHLIDLIAMYRSILIKLPYLYKLGIDAVQLRTMNKQIGLTNLKIGDNIHWYNPGKLIYYAFTNGIIALNQETNLNYYIDPFSMCIAKLTGEIQTDILPIYYKLYNKIIPQFFETISKFWNQLSGIAAYAVITRVGKRYCPYLIRWHWTLLLIIGFIEQIFIYFIYRVAYFQANILIPQTLLSNDNNQNIISQINMLNALIGLIISLHLGLILFGLFHAIWGQYFYFPFIVENTELHVGPRPKNSIYSGGKTAWQDEKENSIQRLTPNFWYGWFGKGTRNHKNIFILFFNILKRKMKK